MTHSRKRPLAGPSFRVLSPREGAPFSVRTKGRSFFRSLEGSRFRPLFLSLEGSLLFFVRSLEGPLFLSLEGSLLFSFARWVAVSVSSWTDTLVISLCDILVRHATKPGCITWRRRRGGGTSSALPGCTAPTTLLLLGRLPSPSATRLLLRRTCQQVARSPLPTMLDVRLDQVQGSRHWAISRVHTQSDRALCYAWTRL